MPKTESPQKPQFAQAGQWIRAGIMSAALLRPAVEKVVSRAQSQSTKAVNAIPERQNELRARIEEQIPLTQAQFEKLAKSLNERVAELSHQAQDRASRLVNPKKGINARVWWGLGIGLGFIAAGATAFVITRRRMKGQSEEELVAIPANANGHHHSPADRLKSAMGRIRHHEDEQSATATAPTSTATATETETVRDIQTGASTEAPFIGNIRTLIFHTADSDHLPSEENRIYFHSEQEALDAGYSAAQGE